MTASDFASFTQNGALCDEEGQLGPDEFEHVMRLHIRQLAQSKLAAVGEERSPEDEAFAQSSAIKVITGATYGIIAERTLADICTFTYICQGVLIYISLLMFAKVC